jgi:sarcosine oxidase
MNARGSYSVIVLGLGGMGSAAAWQLARRGVRTLGLEQFTPAHNRGSSHGRTRVIRQAYFEHPSYVPLLLRAYELWHEAEDALGEQLLNLCGGLMMGSPTSEVVAGSIRSAVEHRLEHEILASSQVRQRYSPLSIPEHHIALFERLAGLVYTEKAVSAHLQLAAKCGANLRFQEPAISWKAEPGGGVSVVTAHGSYFAERLIITAGAWAPRMLAGLGIPLRVERQVLYWFQPEKGIEPFLPDRFPIYIWQNDRGLQPYGFPAMDGPHGGVKIAFFRMPRAQICTPETVNRELLAEDEAQMRSSIREFLPSLDGALVHATTCMYTTTPDMNFVIGVHPELPQVSFAAGFSGHGFKFCSLVGEVMADLAINGETVHDLSLFDLNRFSQRSQSRS